MSYLLRAAFGILFCLLGACAPTARPVPKYDIRLMALDRLTEHHIRYVSHRRVRLPAGQLKALVTFRNEHRNSPISVDWKCVFYDKDGFQIEETEWNTKVFPREQETLVQFNSMARNAADFLLMIRGSIS